MLNENAQAWVEALRSGDYQQANGRLRNDENRFCCLGVACDVFTKNHPDKAHWINNAFITLTTVSLNNLPIEVSDWLGLAGILRVGHQTNLGEYVENSKGENLASLNDTRNYSFRQIADVIESEPEGLFSKN